MKDSRRSGKRPGKKVVVETDNDDKSIDVNNETFDDDFVEMGRRSSHASGLQRSGRNKDKEVYDSDHAKTVASGSKVPAACPRKPARRRKRCMYSVLFSLALWRMEWYSLFKRSCSARGKNCRKNSLLKAAKSNQSGLKSIITIHHVEDLLHMGDPILSINRGYCLLERTGFLLIEALKPSMNSDWWRITTRNYSTSAVLFANLLANLVGAGSTAPERPAAVQHRYECSPSDILQKGFND
ncbi:hypothetical protein Tco_1113180 [Tanacetum coccineum]|uniref:Uncharacterized protein n=1 Tax=Tanacetum coccineum TaxID=301880 RepID=A0ABQ5IRJ1_9ASTR